MEFMTKHPKPLGRGRIQRLSGNTFLALACLVLVLALIGRSDNTHAHTIVTVAGGGSADGIPAVNSMLAAPSAVAVDASGNLYVADVYNSRIRKVGNDGIITSVAGTGFYIEPNSFVENAPAVQTSIGAVLGIVVASDGSLVYSEAGSNRIRRIAIGGTVSTIAGTGGSGFAGDGGPALAALLNAPTGLAIGQDGSIYVSDTANHRVRKIAPDGVISTVAGIGQAGLFGDDGPAAAAKLSSPQGLAMDGAGTLFIADKGNHRVRKVLANGTISSIPDGGLAFDIGTGNQVPIYGLFQPKGVAIDQDGALLIADSGKNRLLKIAPNGQRTLLIGSDGITSPGDEGDGGPSTAARVRNPTGLAVQGGSIFIADADNNKIRRIDSMGSIDTVAGAGSIFSDEGLLATNAFLRPTSMTIGQDGGLYFVDQSKGTVRRVQADGTLKTLAGNGTFGTGGNGVPATSVGLGNPRSIAVGKTGEIYIVDAQVNKVWMVAPDGQMSVFAGNGGQTTSGDGGQATQAGLNLPAEVLLDYRGRVFIRCNDSIRVVENGIIQTFQTGNFQGIAADKLGNIYMSTFIPSQILRKSATGQVTVVGGSDQRGDSGDGGLARAAAMAVSSIAADAAGTVHLVNDNSGATAIRRISLIGTIDRVGGRGSNFSANGIDSLSAFLAGATSVSVSDEGEVYFTEATNALAPRIRKITLDDVPSAPTNVSVVPSKSSAVFTFTPPVNNGGRPIVEYLAHCGAEGAHAFSRSSPVIVGNLPDGQLHQCQLYAINDKSLGLPSGAIGVTPSTSAPFAFLGAYSRRSHGEAGVMDLPIAVPPASASETTIEPRSFGTDREIVLRFTNLVSSVSSVSTLGVPSSHSFVGNELRVFLNSEADNKDMVIAATGINGLIDLSIPIRFVAGDVTKTGTVNAGDIAAVKSRTGRNVLFANFEFDVDGSGSLDVGDVRLTKARAGTTLN